MTDSSPLLNDLDPAKVAALAEVGVSPQEFCLSVNRTSEILNSSIVDFVSFSPEKVALYEGFSTLKELGTLGKTLHQGAMDNDSVICAEHNDGFHGSYNTVSKTVNFNLGNNNQVLPTTLLEEFTHAAQDQSGLAVPLWDDNLDITNHDKFIAALSTEAQAKLIVARQAVESYWNEDHSIYDSIEPKSAIYFMAENLMESVSQKGLEALDDPDVLFDTYKVFFSHDTRHEVQEYAVHFASTVFEEDAGNQRITADQYAEAFGTLENGSDINFLQGNISSIDDIADIIHENSIMASVLLEDFQLMAAENLKADVPPPATIPAP